MPRALNPASGVPVILLFTDFGVDGPYVGQVTVALARVAPRIPVVSLMGDAPRWNPRAASHLLSALAREVPEHCVLLGIVDPGVGTSRDPVVLRAHGRWFVGPDNGLFEHVAAADPNARCWRIRWRPKRLSNSFHGRDLFAPVAARLALGESPAREWLEPRPVNALKWPHVWQCVIYVDRYGNCMTGIPAAAVGEGAQLSIAGRSLPRASTFAQVPAGEAFWYVNSLDLVEVAVNQGAAADLLRLHVGTAVQMIGLSGAGDAD